MTEKCCYNCKYSDRDNGLNCKIPFCIYFLNNGNKIMREDKTMKKIIKIIFDDNSEIELKGEINVEYICDTIRNKKETCNAGIIWEDDIKHKYIITVDGFTYIRKLKKTILEKIKGLIK